MYGLSIKFYYIARERFNVLNKQMFHKLGFRIIYDTGNLISDYRLMWVNTNSIARLNLKNSICRQKIEVIQSLNWMVENWLMIFTGWTVWLWSSLFQSITVVKRHVKESVGDYITLLFVQNDLVKNIFII